MGIDSVLSFACVNNADPIFIQDYRPILHSIALVETAWIRFCSRIGTEVQAQYVYQRP